MIVNQKQKYLNWTIAQHLFAATPLRIPDIILLSGKNNVEQERVINVLDTCTIAEIPAVQQQAPEQILFLAWQYNITLDPAQAQQQLDDWTTGLLLLLLFL